MDATVANDYDGFVSVCDDTMKAALTKQNLEGVSKPRSPPAPRTATTPPTSANSTSGFRGPPVAAALQVGRRRAGDHERQGRQGRGLLPALKNRVSPQLRPVSSIEFACNSPVRRQASIPHVPPHRHPFSRLLCLSAAWWPGAWRRSRRPRGQRLERRQVRGRDYLTLRNVADFYKLQYSRPSGRLGGAHRRPAAPSGARPGRRNSSSTGSSSS